MMWGEAWRLTGLLAVDPSSQVAAALSGWYHPIDRVDLTLRDLYDLTHAVGAAGSKQKPKPYPRPWDARPKRLTEEELAEARAALGRARALAREAVEATPGRVV